MIGPVHDMHDHVVWRVRVLPDEMTCLGCGETFVAGRYCVNCSVNEDGTRRRNPPPAVPTVSYLREGEYEMAR